MAPSVATIECIDDRARIRARTRAADAACWDEKGLDTGCGRLTAAVPPVSTLSLFTLPAASLASLAFTLSLMRRKSHEQMT
jgi:hypothetical protein